MSKPYFAHRPPTTGVHLLSDPFPPRTVSPAALQNENAGTAISRRQTRPAKTKKTSLRV